MDVVTELRNEIMEASDRYEEARKKLDTDETIFQAGLLAGLRQALNIVTNDQACNDRIYEYIKKMR